MAFFINPVPSGAADSPPVGDGVPLAPAFCGLCPERRQAPLRPHPGFPPTKQARVHPYILGCLGYGAALVDDECNGTPFKVGRILFPSLTPPNPPPLAINAFFDVFI
ncbi:MAG TPA: hypothetical protein VLA60_09210 [Nitrospirales bacterium]|nr:hypothetical protein [Nitrospirales bacterium]